MASSSDASFSLLCSLCPSEVELALVKLRSLASGQNVILDEFDRKILSLACLGERIYASDCAYTYCMLALSREKSELLGEGVYSQTETPLGDGKQSLYLTLTYAIT
jgi:hypothetical protein